MFQLDMRSRVPIYEQIISSIKELAVRGVLKPGEKLPSVRELSRQMTINPNTIQKAYQELERQGIIYMERGKGTFISPDIQATNKDSRIKDLKENLRKILVECIYLGINQQELKDMITDVYEKITEYTEPKEAENAKRS